MAHILRRIGLLGTDAPVIRRKVGETLTAALRIDTDGLAVHRSEEHTSELQSH